MTCHDLAKRGRNLLPATACPPIVMASGQCPYRLLFIYGYKIVGSSSRMPSLPLFSNSYPVPLSGAAFHIRSALLLFCSSPVLQFTSGTPLSMCKPSKSDGAALRSAAVQPRDSFAPSVNMNWPWPELHAGIQNRCREGTPFTSKQCYRKAHCEYGAATPYVMLAIPKLGPNEAVEIEHMELWRVARPTSIVTSTRYCGALILEFGLVALRTNGGSSSA